MTQGERIRAIRKAVGLTLEKFGEKIGFTKSAMSQLENDKYRLNERAIKSICREFDVDYIWLTRGEGEMFIDKNADIYHMIDELMDGESESRKNLFKAMVNLKEKDIEAIIQIIDTIKNMDI